MIRYISLLLFIGLAWGQSKMDIDNLIDRGGLLYKPNDNRPYTGSVFGFYENGNEKINGRCRNGQKNGKWTWRNKEGFKDSSGTYINGVRNGRWTYWYENGQKEKDGIYKRGVKNGQWTLWLHDGKEISKIIYKHGKIWNGKWTYLYDNGRKSGEGIFREGIPDGQWVFYYDNGAKKAEGFFTDGKQDGVWIFWYKNGDKRLETTFVVGHPIKPSKEQLMSGAALGQAMVAMNRGDYFNAQFQLKTLLNDYDGTESASISRYYLGKMKYEDGEDTAAEEYLIKFADNKPIDLLYPSAMLMLSDIYLRKNDINSSLSFLDEGIKRSNVPYSKQMFELEKAKLYIKQGDYDIAGSVAHGVLKYKSLSPANRQAAEEIIGSLQR